MATHSGEKSEEIKMIKNFKFDYDVTNDSLFIYNPRSKTKASIELDNLIIDFNTKKEIVAVELHNATSFFSDISTTNKITKIMLEQLHSCKVEIIPKGNTTIMKLFMQFNNQSITAPLIIPTVTEPSPSLATV